MNEQHERIILSLSYFFTKKTKVHVELYQRRWYNGIIKEYDEKRLIILDHKLKKEVLILINDIKIIEPYMEKVKYES